jgi:hypothetical protein
MNARCEIRAALHFQRQGLGCRLGPVQRNCLCLRCRDRKQSLASLLAYECLPGPLSSRAMQTFEPRGRERELLPLHRSKPWKSIFDFEFCLIAFLFDADICPRVHAISFRHHPTAQYGRKSYLPISLFRRTLVTHFVSGISSSFLTSCCLTSACDIYGDPQRYFRRFIPPERNDQSP